MFEASAELITQIEPRQQAGGVDLIGEPTGFPDLDYVLGGYRKGDMYGVAAKSGGGKDISIDTPIPTPFGWTTMGDVKVGDVVFDEQGRMCNVTYKSPVFTDHRCYRVVFDDGSTIIASDTHQWLTHSAAARQSASQARRIGRDTSRPLKRYGSDQSHKRIMPSVVTTQQIKDTLRTGNARNKLNHAIPVHEGLRTPDAALAVAPYTLGVWLGDGYSASGRVCGVDEDIFENIRRDGYHVVEKNSHQEGLLVVDVQGLGSLLRDKGLRNNKHIPCEYLRASYEQRLNLMRGLMDTDGSIKHGNSCEITQKREDLAKGIWELALSLGWKASLRSKIRKAHKDHEDVYYHVQMTPNINPFRISRKASRWQGNPRLTTRFRYIVSVEEVETVPTQCITVDSPSHLYLAGETMVPTHNTAFCVSTAMATAQRGGSVFYASLEMSAHMMALRILSGITGVPALLIEKGKMKDETFRFVRSEAEKLNKLPLYFYDQGLDATKLNMVSLQVQNEFGLDLAVVDYIALLRDAKGTSAYEKATQKADDLKAYAVDFDVPIVVASQLNRASLNREGGRPELQDFKETGQIENNSTAAIFPFVLPREDEGEESPDVLDGELIIAKNRHGPSGMTIPVEFLPKQMLWRPKGGVIIDPPQNVRSDKRSLSAP